MDARVATVLKGMLARSKSKRPKPKVQMVVVRRTEEVVAKPARKKFGQQPPRAPMGGRYNNRHWQRQVCVG